MVWLERSALRARAKNLKPATLNASNELAMRIWGVTGGIDWTALPLLVEFHGVTDVERLLDALLARHEYEIRRSQQ
jgi:hypothetical protein